MIEIFENTLLKLIFRQGSDLNRKHIVLGSGEPAYTTDTKRMWVGDGINNGGVLVGNLFKGSGVDVTSFAPSEIGDYAYDTDNNKLYRLKINDGSNLSDWELIGGVYAAADSTISINNNNGISVNVNALSGFTVTPLYARYNGFTDTRTYDKNITSVTKIGVGHYAFNYGPLETSNLIPNIQIFGETNLDHVARVITLSNTSCQVKFQNLSGGLADADVFFSIIR
jgi:hypothetical protein